MVMAKGEQKGNREAKKPKKEKVKTIPVREKEKHERQGEIIAIARGRVTCPAQAPRVWLHSASIEAGPIFRQSTGAAPCATCASHVVQFPTS